MMAVRTYRGANADCDHYLVVTSIRAKIRSKYVLNKEKTIRYKQPKTDRDRERI
jgi:hypothetical protein